MRRVRPEHRDYWKSEPQPEEWLLIEWPKDASEPIKYWLSTLPADTTCYTIAFYNIVESRVAIEQAERCRVFKKYSQVKLQVKREALNRINRSAGELSDTEFLSRGRQLNGL